jgi:hypothetical protein
LTKKSGAGRAKTHAERHEIKEGRKKRKKQEREKNVYPALADGVYAFFF